MAPIYAVDSFLSILHPPAAIYINMLRDCYEAYVLYLFLSLMLAYLNSDEDDYEVIVYLETKLPYTSHKQYNKGSLSKGKAFLRYCKFGVLQVTLFRIYAFGWMEK